MIGEELTCKLVEAQTALSGLSSLVFGHGSDKEVASVLGTESSKRDTYVDVSKHV